MPASPARAAAFIGAPDRRRFLRTDIEVSGRVLDRRGREQDCRTADISPGGARLVASAPPVEGESVVLYFSEFGRTPGEVVRVEPGGHFSVAFHTSAHKREKLAEQLTWMLNKGLFAHEEERRSARHEAAGAVSVELDDGTRLYCEVRDFSLVGCSLKTAQARPTLGGWVRVGQTYGRVARYLEDGFAVDFEARLLR